jgi:hypothetical protein
MLTMHSGSVLMSREATTTAVARKSQFQDCMFASVLRVF